MFWVPLLILFLPFSRSDCRGSDCSKFKCSSEPFPPRPLDPYLRPGSTFTTPCSCQPDWNDIFCNLTQYLLSTPTTTSIEHPIVCVCRKFSDNYSKCEQFISRCFHHKNKGCSCCFNQPYQYCNQLSCKNNEPDFSGSNTTCVCHHHPTDYPYQICKAMYARDGTQLQPAAQPVDMEQPKKITLLGISVPITAFLYVMVGLLIAVALLTVIILIAGNRKVSRRREDSSRQRQAAEEALLRQQQEDDRYLPTV